MGFCFSYLEKGVSLESCSMFFRILEFDLERDSSIVIIFYSKDGDAMGACYVA